MARYLSFSVIGGVQWPIKEDEFSFGENVLVVLPCSRQYDASIHIDLDANKISQDDALSLLCEFASLVAWEDDQFLALRNGGCGAAKPCPFPRSSKLGMSSIFEKWPCIWSPIATEKHKVALALYREALNSGRSDCPQFSLLSFYKILEHLHPSSSSRVTFMENIVADLSRNNSVFKDELKRSGLYSLGVEEISKYLYKNGRGFVAHSSKPPFLNPDSCADMNIVGQTLWLMQMLARLAIARYFELDEEFIWH